MAFDTKTCIITRHLGHKSEMNNQPGQWQMLTKDKSQCWVCDKWLYALVFYSPHRAMEHNNEDALKLVKAMKKQGIRMEHGERPTVYGSFTNWASQEMMKLSDFIYSLDEKPDILEMLQDQGKIRTSAENVSELNQREMKIYNQAVAKYDYDLFSYKWDLLICKHLRYKKPAIINLLPEDYAAARDLYILPCFTPPGKQQMLFSHQN